MSQVMDHQNNCSVRSANVNVLRYDRHRHRISMKIETEKIT